MKFYPVNLNIKGRLCVVFGGGAVAERKVKNILIYGGRVKVVSPELRKGLKRLVAQGRIEYEKTEYRSGLLRGAMLVYAATSDRQVNSQIAKEASRSGILVNVCDSAKESNFILPAILRKKGFTIAVSTDGFSPAKAVAVRDKIKEKMGPSLFSLHSFLREK